MDDQSIVSTREQEIESELEDERRQASKGRAAGTERRSANADDTAAPNELGGGAGSGVGATASTGDRRADNTNPVTPEISESHDYAGAGPGDGDQRDVDEDERPGESFSPRSG